MYIEFKTNRCGRLFACACDNRRLRTRSDACGGKAQQQDCQSIRSQQVGHVAALEAGVIIRTLHFRPENSNLPTLVACEPRKSLWICDFIPYDAGYWRSKWDQNKQIVRPQRRNRRAGRASDTLRRNGLITVFVRFRPRLLSVNSVLFHHSGLGFIGRECLGFLLLAKHISKEADSSA